MELENQEVDKRKRAEANRKPKQSGTRDVTKLRSCMPSDSKPSVSISKKEPSPRSSVPDSKRKRRLELEASMPGGNNATTFQSAI